MMRNYLRICSFYLLLLKLLADDSLNDTTHLPFGGYYCWARCIGKCLEDDPNQSIESCGQQCAVYKNNTLCTEATCWLTCNDLIDGIQGGPDPPDQLSAAYGTGSYDPYLANLNWTAVSKATLYVLQFKDATDVFSSWTTDDDSSLLTRSTDYVYKKSLLCVEFQFRVAAVNSKGISQFTQAKTLKKPVPVFPSDAKLSRITPLIFKQEPWFSRVNELEDNATVYVDLNFTAAPYWGSASISGVDLVVAHTRCSYPVFGRTIPTAKYSLDAEVTVIHVKIPSTVMRQKCLQYFKLETVTSKCGTKATFPGPMITADINCNVVKNSPCKSPKPAKPPYCTTEAFSCNISSSGQKCEEANLEENSTTTVDIAWSMHDNQRFKPPLYYAVRWGPAKAVTQELPFGLVYLTDIKGSKTNCDTTRSSDLAPECKEKTWLTLEEVPVGQLWGVQMCAVYDKRQEFFPDRNLSKISTAKIFIPKKSSVQKRRTTPFGLMALAICAPLGLAISFFILVLFCLFRRHKSQKKEMERLQHEMAQRELEERYTEMPRKHDIWELDRRNLIIYNDRKLGSGAFGAVFMGKVAGRVLGHKDSTSALATNLMRVENAEVAVKMLPEYADEISKADFLKEINLMKQLGYHERLVNMMACITNSEPYCLVVEYCSDGDLLHFLRDRCKYMMKLDQLEIDYINPKPEDNVETNLILSLKELIGLAVQCSVGMEYLSQKGFVHRDVAARNVLVHNKKYAKIGDFGLCRFVYGEDSAYWGKGGRLPIKWMSPEAIKNYEFTSKSDVWSFGVLLFEIITMGGCPYPGIQPADVEAYLEEGCRMDKPDNCPENYYKVMLDCWEYDSEKRLTFSQARERLAKMLEQTVEDYSYLVLNQKRDYYNVPYEQQEAFFPDAQQAAQPNCETAAVNNNVFESIPEEAELKAQTDQSAGASGNCAPNFPTNEPDKKQVELSQEAGVSTRVGLQKLINGPPRKRNLDSCSSIKPLITPSSTSSGEVRFFDAEMQKSNNGGSIEEEHGTNLADSINNNHFNFNAERDTEL